MIWSVGVGVGDGVGDELVNSWNERWGSVVRISW
jgi:hypothetical protein